MGPQYVLLKIDTSFSIRGKEVYYYFYKKLIFMFLGNKDLTFSVSFMFATNVPSINVMDETA
jgi:hypothetical protein